jgi:hypothetical protein
MKPEAWKDEIVEEVRTAREAYARRFNFDLDAIFEDLKQRQASSGRKVVSFPPRKPVENELLPKRVPVIK